MKLVNFYRKPISIFVMVAFTILLCFWANQSPAAPAAEKSSTATLENSASESAGFIESEAPVHAYKKGKKFPWLIVALVAVAGGAALYFLVLKKKDCTLTVTVGEGVTGTPAAGTSTNKKGTAVAYSYTLQSGYDNLSVTLDGAAVAASGSVTMNANHTLAASATKTFVLTVIRGAHVDGTPASGTYSHASGASVPYGYTPASGYSNLEVKIDNVAAAPAGTITMNTNHTLTATVANPTGANLEINSTPAGANIYLDKVDSGQVTPYTFNFPTAVTKLVILRYVCGYEDYFQDSVNIGAGQTKVINASLPFGIAERFTVPASPCWIPYYAGSWSMYIGSGGDNYRYTGTVPGWSTNVYSSPFNGNYAAIVRINRKQSTTYANGIFLGTGTDMTNANGYMFFYTSNGNAWSYRFTGVNLITGSGGSEILLGGGSYGAIVQGLNKWNYLKIVKSGSNYSFYANNIFLHSFSDATHNPTYLTLAFWSHNQPTDILVDYVYLHTGTTAGSVPAQPVKITPGMTKENLLQNTITGERKD
jgi:hypothetical protein